MPLGAAALTREMPGRGADGRLMGRKIEQPVKTTVMSPRYRERCVSAVEGDDAAERGQRRREEVDCDRTLGTQQSPSKH